MTLEDVVKHFGSQANAARHLKVKPASVSMWRKGIPTLRQIYIERVTRGALKADIEENA